MPPPPPPPRARPAAQDSCGCVHAGRAGALNFTITILQRFAKERMRVRAEAVLVGTQENADAGELQEGQVVVEQSPLAKAKARRDAKAARRAT